MNALLCIGSFVGALILVVMGYALVRMFRRLDGWRGRECMMTSIYPSVYDDATASGYHEESRKI